MNASEQKLRDEICRVGAALFSRGYVHSTAGNISARLEDGYLITPTDACMGFLDPARIAKLDKNVQQISGDRASKTIFLHSEVYKEEDRINGIVHTHSTNLVALSLLPDTNPQAILPPLTPYYVMKVGAVPLIPYRRPGAPDVASLIKPHIRSCRGVMLASLGPMVWGATVSEAAFALEELEETAKLWLMLKDRAPSILSEEQVSELHTIFGKP